MSERGLTSRYSLPTLDWLDLPDGGSRFSLEEILDAAATAGFTSVGLDTVTTTGAADIGELLRARGLTCTDVGDRAGAMLALTASSDALLREARQLSADASAVMSEVLITVDGLAGSAAEIFAILLHEALHAVAFERGIKDTSRQRRYHNAQFRAVAEELGLETGRDSPFGWSSTALAPGTTALYRETLRALTEALGDDRDHSTALGDARARRGEVTLMCDCGHRVRPAHRQSIREAICTRCKQRDARHCI